jgi:hypothetical protein
MNLTDWFPETVKPVHVGVYETKHQNGTGATFWRYWNGRLWLLPNTSSHCVIQTRQWRGLREPA